MAASAGPVRRERPVTWDIAEEHLDEGAFVHRQWLRALESPLRDTAQVIEGPEERLRAHVDALVLGGARVEERLLLPALAGDDEGRAFVAALALLETDPLARLPALLEAAAGGANQAAIVRALSLSPATPVLEWLVVRMSQARGPERVVILDALAEAGVTAGAVSASMLNGAEPPLLEPALRAHVADPSVPAAVFDQHLGSPLGPIADAALVGALLRGSKAAWARVQGAAGPQTRPVALVLAATLGGPAEAQHLLAAADGADPRLEILQALGLTGHIEAAVRRQATLSFHAITALPLSRPYLQAVEDAPAEDEPELPALLLDAPEPDAEAVEAWWRQERPRFSPQPRSLLGRPADGDAALGVLRRGPMHLRAPLALEWAVRTRGAFLVRTRDWVSRQLVALRAVPSLGPALR